MWALALSFTKSRTDDFEQLSALLLIVGGLLMFMGSSVPFGRRGGQALGGVAVAAAGVLLLLALRYGTA
jgi:hypothetical protein